MNSFFFYFLYSFAVWMIYHQTCSIMYPYREYLMPLLYAATSMNAMLLMIKKSGRVFPLVGCAECERRETQSQESGTSIFYAT